MTRQERLLRLARLRGDRAAVAILERDRRYRLMAESLAYPQLAMRLRHPNWTEAELRAAWGDR